MYEKKIKKRQGILATQEAAKSSYDTTNLSITQRH